MAEGLPSQLGQLKASTMRSSIVTRMIRTAFLLLDDSSSSDEDIDEKRYIRAQVLSCWMTFHGRRVKVMVVVRLWLVVVRW